MSTSALSVLTAARELLADPARWCPDAGGHYAVDAQGIGVEPLDGRAARWELLGAVERCALGGEAAAYGAAQALADALYGEPVVAEVDPLQAVRRLIRELRGERVETSRPWVCLAGGVDVGSFEDAPAEAQGGEHG